MAPKKKAEKPAGDGAEKPLPLRTDKAEKMRNPTARLGPGGESNRAGKPADATAKKGQTSNRGGKAKADKESPPSQRGAKPAAAAAAKKPMAKIPEAVAPTGPTGGAGASGAKKPEGGGGGGGGSMPGGGAKKIDYLTEEMM